MRDGERGHDLHRSRERVREAEDGVPTAVGATGDRGQEQRDQEQHVIEAGPNVPDAVLHERRHRGEPARHLPCERRLAMVRSENRYARVTGEHRLERAALGIVAGAGAQLGRPREGDLHEAAMLRIDVEEQVVDDRQRSVVGGGLASGGDEAEHRVRAVGMPVDQHVLDARGAPEIPEPQRETIERVGDDPPHLAAHLAPREGAVVVAVERDRVVEVAERDVPLSSDARAFNRDRKIAVARLGARPTASARASRQRRRGREAIARRNAGRTPQRAVVAS
jgi:hypothetical protein